MSDENRTARGFNYDRRRDEVRPGPEDERGADREGDARSVLAGERQSAPEVVAAADLASSRSDLALDDQRNLSALLFQCRPSMCADPDDPAFVAKAREWAERAATDLREETGTPWSDYHTRAATNWMPELCQYVIELADRLDLRMDTASAAGSQPDLKKADTEVEA